MYTIVINEGPDEFTFEAPRVSFLPRLINTWNDAGLLDSSEFILLLNGVLIGASPDPAADVMAKWKEVLDVAERNVPQRVRIFRDATLEVDLNPADVVSGPFIRSFEIDPTGAMFANHVRFRMEVATTKQGSGQFSSNPEIVNLRREIETETFNNEIERKEWRATASGDDALNLVQGFKPTDAEPLREIITEQIDQNTASARYIFEAKKDDKRIEESIVIDPGGRPLVAVLIQPSSAPALGGVGGLAGFALAIDSPPKMFRGRARPIRLTVTGKITSKDATVAVPTLHFPDEHYDGTLSKFDFEPRYNPETKVFEINYTEVYTLKEGPIPPANHGGHPDAITGLTVPPDGAIAG